MRESNKTSKSKLRSCDQKIQKFEQKERLQSSKVISTTKHVKLNPMKQKPPQQSMVIIPEAAVNRDQIIKDLQQHIIKLKSENAQL